MKQSNTALLVMLILSAIIMCACSNRISISNKIQIQPKIVESQYCDYRREDDKTNCICQYGYTKVTTGSLPDCHPSICTLITSIMISGDVGLENSLVCVNALRLRNYTYCDYLEGQDRDICLLAYVSLTNETSKCALIEDENIARTCES